SGRVNSRSGGGPPRSGAPSAPAASGGTASNASHVSPSAVAPAARIATTTSTIEASGTSAQPRPDRRPASRVTTAGAPPRGSATSALCTLIRHASEIQKPRVIECPGWESNPQAPWGTADFKSTAFAVPPPGQACAAGVYELNRVFLEPPLALGGDPPGPERPRS